MLDVPSVGWGQSRVRVKTNIILTPLHVKDLIVEKAWVLFDDPLALQKLI